MSALRKQGFLNTIISYAGMVLGYVNQILLVPHLLTPNQVGLTRFLIQISPVYAQLAAFGFTSISTRYFPYFKDKEKQHNGFLFLMLLIPVAGFVVVTALFLLFKPKVVHLFGKESPMAVEYYYYIIPLSFFSLLFMLLDAYLRSLYKTVVQTFLQDFMVRVLLLVLVLAYAEGWFSFHWFVILYIAANSCTALVCIIYLLWLGQFFLKPAQNISAIIPLKEVMQYGLYSFFGNVSSTIIGFIDSAMIASYRGLDGVAFYTTGFFITSAIRVPSIGLNKIASPKVAEYFKQGDMGSLEELYKTMTRVNMAIGYLLFLGIWCNVDNIFALMPNDYSAGRYVILFMGLARLFDLSTSINGMIILTSDKYRYDLIFNILMMVLVAYTNYLLIPTYGISGAAFASMMVYVFYNLFRVIFVSHYFKMQPFGWDSFWIVAITLAAYAASWLMPSLPNTFADILVRSTLITLVYGGLMLGLKVSPEWNASFQKVLKLRES